MPKKLKNPMVDFDMKEYMSGGVMSSTVENDDKEPSKENNVKEVAPKI